MAFDDGSPSAAPHRNPLRRVASRWATFSATVNAEGDGNDSVVPKFAATVVGGPHRRRTTGRETTSTRSIPRWYHCITPMDVTIDAATCTLLQTPSPRLPRRGHHVDNGEIDRHQLQKLNREPLRHFPDRRSRGYRGRGQACEQEQSKTTNAIQSQRLHSSESSKEHQHRCERGEDQSQPQQRFEKLDPLSRHGVDLRTHETPQWR